MTAYRWRIVADHLFDDDAEYAEFSSKGVAGPERRDDAIGHNAAEWVAFDDDGEPYFTGLIWGEYSGIEPLEDFARSIGCTRIKINGE